MDHGAINVKVSEYFVQQCITIFGRTSTLVVQTQPHSLLPPSPRAQQLLPTMRTSWSSAHVSTTQWPLYRTVDRCKAGGGGEGDGTSTAPFAARGEECHVLHLRMGVVEAVEVRVGNG